MTTPPDLTPLARPPAQGRPARARIRLVPAAALVAAAVLIPAASAAAHVSVHPDTTTAGAESAEMTFRVPTESDSASTVGLELSLPTGHPLAEVLARPIAGWSITVTTGKLPKPVVIDGTTFTEAPLTVTWKATGAEAGVKPGQYQDFAISAGPLPDSGDVTFTAKQTYSDGSVVNWNQPTVEGQDEPEHPAPGFTVTPASAGESSGPSSSDGHSATAATGSAATKVEPTGSDHTARWLAGVGLVAGLLALGGVAVGAGRSRRDSR